MASLTNENLLNQPTSRTLLFLPTRACICFVIRSMDQQQPEIGAATAPQEESWEHTNFAAEYTPHTSRRIALYYPYLSPLWKMDPSTASLDNNKSSSSTATYGIDIQSVDTSKMTLLDVCNYTPEPNVDGSGHCVWLGAIYWSHVLSIGMALAETKLHRATRTKATGAATTTTSTTKDQGTAGAQTSSSQNATETTCWYDDRYFQQKVVVELGCGTGAAGIALLKLLSMKSTNTTTTVATATATFTTVIAPAKTSRATPKEFLFWDNDPEALELCRQNCQHNLQVPPVETSSRVACQHRLDPGWILDSEAPTVGTKGDWNNNNQDSTSTGHIDTILATDVLYDLKIIRPFLETAARMLSNTSITEEDIHKDGSTSVDDGNKTGPTTTSAAAAPIANQHLILSHVPRWFLPRDAANTSVTSTTTSDTRKRAETLEEHIVQEASQCGLSLLHTVRPMDILDQFRYLLILLDQDSDGDTPGQQLGEEARESLLQDLDDMDQAGAVLWVFVLDTK